MTFKEYIPDLRSSVIFLTYVLKSPVQWEIKLASSNASASPTLTPLERVISAHPCKTFGIQDSIKTKILHDHKKTTALYFKFRPAISVGYGLPINCHFSTYVSDATGCTGLASLNGLLWDIRKCDKLSHTRAITSKTYRRRSLLPFPQPFMTIQ